MKDEIPPRRPSDTGKLDVALRLVIAGDINLSDDDSSAIQSDPTKASNDTDAGNRIMRLISLDTLKRWRLDRTKKIDAELASLK